MRLLFLLLMFSCFIYCQEEEDSLYFPQEMLEHPDCENAEDKGACLKDRLQKDLSQLLAKGINQFGTEKDTIKASFFLNIDETGKIKEESNPPFISDSILRNKLSDRLKLFNGTIPKLRILNKKPDSCFVSHRILFKFLVQNSKDSLMLIPIETSANTYQGGVIVKVPVYPGCDKNLRLCFNQKMQSHIAQNFRYPNKAQKKKIQGKVHIMFDISKNGSVQNVRTRGPNIILENEAKRIIKLLPKMKPGTHNGEPVITPFAIPITFRLQ